MKLTLSFIVAIGFVITSCGSRENHSNNDSEILGAYVKEYSFKVIHPSTGNEIGMSTIRDTIFIRVKQKGFEVSNNKWKLNDYDKEGWRNMEHSEDRPLPTYRAEFDRTDNSLNAQLFPSLHFDLAKKILYKGKNHDSPYRRVHN